MDLIASLIDRLGFCALLLSAVVWIIYRWIREGFELQVSRETRRRWLKDFSLGDWYLGLLNGALDWLSLGVSRGLLGAIASRLHGSARALLWALADLVLALVFLVLVTAATVGLVALANRMAVLGGGVPLVDLDGVLLGIAVAHGDPRHYWVYLMLLSTLVPTLVHLFIAGIAATLWLGHFPPLARWRVQVAERLADDADARSGAAAYLTAAVLAGTLVPLGLLWLAWQWTAALWDWDLPDILLDLLRQLARLIDPCMP